MDNDTLMKPLAFIDVDGVLNRLCPLSEANERGLYVTKGFYNGQGYELHLDLEDKRRLVSLTPEFELAWGTTWQDSANKEIGEKIGLPHIETVARSRFSDCSKWPGVVEAANGRPFVWFEDDRGYAIEAERAPYDAAYKIIYVDPRIGLTDNDIQKAKNWYKELSWP